MVPCRFSLLYTQLPCSIITKSFLFIETVAVCRALRNSLVKLSMSWILNLVARTEVLTLAHTDSEPNGNGLAAAGRTFSQNTLPLNSEAAFPKKAILFHDKRLRNSGINIIVYNLLSAYLWQWHDTPCLEGWTNFAYLPASPVFPMFIASFIFPITKRTKNRPYSFTFSSINKAFKTCSFLDLSSLEPYSQLPFY